MKKVTEFKKPVLNTLGERIKAERTKLGLSQEEFGKLLFVSKQQMNYYETDRREPDITKLKKIAENLNVSVDYLLCLSESKNISNTEISRMLGLSNNSINTLSIFTKKDAYQLDALYGNVDNYQDFSIILNKIIENENFVKLIYFIRKYINSFKIAELKNEIELNKIVDIDSDTNQVITKKDLLLNTKEQNICNEDDEKTSDTDIYLFKINSLFNKIIDCITQDLESCFAERWTLNEDKTQVVPICKDGSEKNSLLKRIWRC